MTPLTRLILQHRQLQLLVLPLLLLPLQALRRPLLPVLPRLLPQKPKLLQMLSIQPLRSAATMSWASWDECFVTKASKFACVGE